MVRPFSLFVSRVDCHDGTSCFALAELEKVHTTLTTWVKELDTLLVYDSTCTHCGRRGGY